MAKPAHLFLLVLSFESFWRFGATAAVIIVQVDYQLSIDGFGRRFWHILIDFEGESIPDFHISVVSPVSSSPCPLSADRDTPSKHHELFGAADGVHQCNTSLSWAAEGTIDIATILKMVGWCLEALEFGMW